MAESPESVDLGQLAEAKRLLLARAARRIFEREQRRSAGGEATGTHAPRRLRGRGTTARQASRGTRGSGLGDATGFRPMVPGTGPFVAGPATAGVQPREEPAPSAGTDEFVDLGTMRRPDADPRLLRDSVERIVEVRSRLDPEDMVIELAEPIALPPVDPVRETFTVRDGTGATFDGVG